MLPYPPGAPPAPSKNLNSSYIVRFWLNFKHHIFICLSLIIEVEIYKWVPFALLPSKSKRKCMVRFYLNLKQNIVVCLPIIQGCHSLLFGKVEKFTQNFLLFVGYQNVSYILHSFGWLKRVQLVDWIIIWIQLLIIHRHIIH